MIIMKKIISVLFSLILCFQVTSTVFADEDISLAATGYTCTHCGSTNTSVTSTTYGDWKFYGFIACQYGWSTHSDIWMRRLVTKNIKCNDCLKISQATSYEYSQYCGR